MCNLCGPTLFLYGGIVDVQYNKVSGNGFTIKGYNLFIVIIKYWF